MESFFQKGKDSDTLVVAFHGTGGNEYQLLTTIAKLFPNASILSFLGDVGVGAQRRFFAPLVQEKVDREDFNQHVENFIENVWPAVEKNSKKIVFIGYSNGANFLLGLLEKAPNIADEFIILHPINLGFQFDASSDANVILTTGSQDTTSVPGDVLKLTKQLETVFSSVELLIADGGHQVTSEEIDKIHQLLQQ